MLPHRPHPRASRAITLASWNLIRAGGGLASAAAGILLLVGHVLNLGGDPEYGTVPGASSVLTAHVLLVFALVALYAAQAERTVGSGCPRAAGSATMSTGHPTASCHSTFTAPRAPGGRLACSSARV